MSYLEKIDNEIPVLHSEMNSKLLWDMYHLLKF